MSVAEYLWMEQMIEQDNKEIFDNKKMFTEYLASFSNPEAVRQLKNDAKNTKKVSDEDFVKTLEHLIGETLDPNLTFLLNKE